MGAKTWMLVLADLNARDALAAKPPLDKEATQELVETLFPGETLELIGDGDLSYMVKVPGKSTGVELF